MEDIEPKLVNCVYILYGVSLLRFGGIHMQKSIKQKSLKFDNPSNFSRWKLRFGTVHICKYKCLKNIIVDIMILP